MNKKQKLLFLATLSIVTSSAALANKADHFAYFGGKMGYNQFEGDCFENYSECDNGSIGYGIFAGYQFNSWLGAEIDAVDYGNYDGISAAHPVEDDIRGYGASLKFSRPVWGTAEAYLRAGAVYVNVNRATDSSSNISPAAALGLAYQLTPSWILRPEYQYLADVDDRSGHFLSLGLSYRFGQVPTSKRSVSTLESEEVVWAVEPETELETETVAPEPTEVVTPEFKEEDVLTSEELFFDLNSSLLTRKAKAELQEMADLIKARPGSNVWIQGYTDSSGSADYNQWLSKRRAKAVGDYLTDLGVSNIYTKGKGIASSTSVKKRNANDRKVIVTITKPNEKLEDF